MDFSGTEKYSSADLYDFFSDLWFGLENDRNPNFCYPPKTNILLKPNYSAKSRIAEYRIVLLNSANLSLFGFGRIFG